MFHVYTDKRLQNSMPWPNPTFKKCMIDFYSILESLSIWCLELLKDEIDFEKLNLSPDLKQLPRPSVFDAFLYPNRAFNHNEVEGKSEDSNCEL